MGALPTVVRPKQVIEMTAFSAAQRYVGIREIAGVANHPLVVWWHSLCGMADATDEVPWCSSFVNGVCWQLRLARSKSAAARSWLLVGEPVALRDAEVGFDVVVLKRGVGAQPGPEVTSGAPGHVGFFAGRDGNAVIVLGGNQGNAVSLARFKAADVLGVRRVSR
jgi:uncharacterized protein (TIGR02594 family)